MMILKTIALLIVAILIIACNNSNTNIAIQKINEFAVDTNITENISKEKTDFFELSEDSILELYKSRKIGDTIFLFTTQQSDYDLTHILGITEGFRYSISKVNEEYVKMESSEYELFYNLLNNTVYKIQYARGIDTFKLVASFKVDTTENHESMHDVSINYKVYKNKTLLRNFDTNKKESNTWSCYTYYRYSHLDIQTIRLKYNTLGFLLKTFSRSGNTYSSNYTYVPISNDSYTSYTIDSKAEPLSEFKDSLLSVWYYTQCWGNGGTASSFYVPHKIDIKLRNGKYKVFKGNVLEDIDFLFISKTDYLFPYDFNLYVAGLNDKNYKLMEYAIDLIDKKQEIDLEWSFHGIGSTIDELVQLKNDIKNGKDVSEKVKQLVDWKNDVK